MTKILTGYDVLVYVKMSNQRCHICIQMSLLSERHLMTVVINMH